MLKDKSFVKQGGIFAALAALLLVLFIFVIPALSKPVDTKKAECETTGVEHKAVIKEDKISPNHIEAKLCDKLTIINDDTVKRLMAFGVHEKHIRYNGVIETLLQPGEKTTITLNTPGTYLFHDHYEESVGSNFTVTE